MFTESKCKGLNSIVMENDSIRLEFIPEYGAKMASFYNKETDREYLFQGDRDELKVPEYGAKFSEYDSTGFDEVFPSIDETFYPEGTYKGVVIPDHGEVWAMPWDVEISGDKLVCSVRSPKLPYKLIKEISLNESSVKIDYRVENLGEEEFKFIWTPHALLNCDHENTKIIMPDEVKKIMNVEKKSKHLGDWGDVYDYPIVETKAGKNLDMSRVEPVTANNCEKFYVLDKLETGKCGVEFSDTQERLTYTFPIDKVPYLGVWKTQGGYRGDYNIALEPCTGIYDDLYVGNMMGKVAVVDAGESYEWYLKMSVERY